MLQEYAPSKFGINRKHLLRSIYHDRRFFIYAPVKYFFWFAQAITQKCLGNDIIEWRFVM